jgi:hypothetical protein
MMRPGTNMTYNATKDSARQGRRCSKSDASANKIASQRASQQQLSIIIHQRDQRGAKRRRNEPAAAAAAAAEQEGRRTIQKEADC